MGGRDHHGPTGLHALEAEIDRLREALRQIATATNHVDDEGIVHLADLRDIARQALAEGER